MATQSFEQLISGASKIKQNELPESNTATLVGEQLLQMVNKQQEENQQRVKGITEYNVSIQHPTSGIDGTNKYTLSTAIALVPSELRTVGLKCSFLGEAGTVETWEYQGGTFASINKWIPCGAQAIDNFKKSITIYNVTERVPLPSGQYYTSKTARAAIPNYLRKKGLIITYQTENKWVKEQCLGIIDMTAPNLFIRSDNWYDFSNIIENYFFDYKNKIGVSTNGGLIFLGSGFVPVKKGDIIYIKTVTYGSAAALATFDKDRVFIKIVKGAHAFGEIITYSIDDDTTKYIISTVSEDKEPVFLFVNPSQDALNFLKLRDNSIENNRIFAVDKALTSIVGKNLILDSENICNTTSNNRYIYPSNNFGSYFKLNELDIVNIAVLRIKYISGNGAMTIQNYMLSNPEFIPVNFNIGEEKIISYGYYENIPSNPAFLQITANCTFQILEAVQFKTNSRYFGGKSAQKISEYFSIDEALKYPFIDILSAKNNENIQKVKVLDFNNSIEFTDNSYKRKFNIKTIGTQLLGISTATFEYGKFLANNKVENFPGSFVSSNIPISSYIGQYLIVGQLLLDTSDGNKTHPEKSVVYIYDVNDTVIATAGPRGLIEEYNINDTILIPQNASYCRISCGINQSFITSDNSEVIGNKMNVSIGTPYKILEEEYHGWVFRDGYTSNASLPYNPMEYDGILSNYIPVKPNTKYTVFYAKQTIEGISTMVVTCYSKNYCSGKSTSINTTTGRFNVLNGGTITIPENTSYILLSVLGSTKLNYDRIKDECLLIEGESQDYQDIAIEEVILEQLNISCPTNIYFFPKISCYPINAKYVTKFLSSNNKADIVDNSILTIAKGTASIGVEIVNSKSSITKSFSINIDDVAEPVYSNQNIVFDTTGKKDKYVLMWDDTVKRAVFKYLKIGPQEAPSLNKDECFYTLGDSITYLGWPAVIAGIAGIKKVKNLAISGQGIQHLLTQAQNIEDDVTVISIMIGTNNGFIPEETYKAACLKTYEELSTSSILADQLLYVLLWIHHNFPSARIVLFSPIYNYSRVVTNEQYGMSHAENQEAAFDYISKFSGVLYVNARKASGLWYDNSFKLHLYDGTHPTALGNQIMSKNLMKYLFR